MVLCQSACKIPSVKVFFASISAFSNFTSVSSKRKASFTTKGIYNPTPGETRWYYRSWIIGVIFERYELLVTALEEIVEEP